MPSDDSKIQLLGAIEDAERAMQLAIDLGLYARLNAEQIRAIREPWAVLGGARRREYPLNTGEVARITGTSAKQIRTWEASSLVPAYRIAGRRRFFSAALVYAFLLKNLDRNDIRCPGAYSPPTQTTRYPSSSPPRSSTLDTTAVPYALTRCSLE